VIALRQTACSLSLARESGVKPPHSILATLAFYVGHNAIYLNELKKILRANDFPLERVGARLVFP
jgi:hypothetical protein